MSLRRLLIHALLLGALADTYVAAEAEGVKVIPSRPRADDPSAREPTKEKEEPEKAATDSPAVHDLTPEEQIRFERALGAFEGKSWRLKKLYLKRLGYIGEAVVPALAERLPKAEGEAAHWIIAALGEIGGDAARAALFETADNGNGQLIKLTALSQLQKFKDARTAAELARHAASKDVPVRTRAVEILSRLGIAETADPLVASLLDKETAVVLTARMGLLTLSRKGTVRHLAAKVVNAWKESGRTPDENSFRLLGELGDDAACYYLETLFDKNQDECAPLAARALGQIGSKRAVRFLSRKPRMLRRNEKLKIVVVEALGGSRNKRDRYAIPVLTDLLEDESEEVKKAAAASLEKITGKKFGLNPARWRDWWTRELFELQDREPAP